MKARLLPVALACLSACGPQADVATTGHDESSAIINGEACGREEFPSAVAILVDGEIDLMGFGTLPLKTVICTGTLIAPDVVLAAAHCVDEAALSGGFGTVTRAQFFITGEPDLSALASGEMNAEFPPDSVPVRETLKHPEFTMDAFNGETAVMGPGDFKDIALLFLERVATITPMHVIAQDEDGALVQSAEVDIAGWGQQMQSTGGPFEPPPRGSVGIKRCARTTINELGAWEMQVGSGVESGRKCHGDSGGPTYLTVAGGMRVVGVTSHAYDQTDCAEKGGIDTRVDVWRDWLDTEMRARCTDASRVWCDAPGIPPADYLFPVIEVDADGGTVISAPDAGVTSEEVDAGTTQQPQGSGGDAPPAGPPVPPGCSHADAQGTGAPWMAVLLGMLGLVRFRRHRG